MARYRTKDDVDLAWNKIRRRLTRQLDTRLADWREEALNKLLSDAWIHFAKSLERGEVLHLDDDWKDWVGRALEEAKFDVQPEVQED